MDDTKKLIEKYKRELMELSEASQRRKTSKTAARTPEIIGYVDEGNAAYDNFLAEIGKTSDSGNADSPTKENSVNTPAEPTAPDVIDGQSSDNIDEPLFITEPDGDMTEIIDESAEEPLFTPPLYNDIPSTERVREVITETGTPADLPPDANITDATNNSATTARPDAADTITTTEAQAERLNDQPVSGTSPDEQLTGRSFEKPSPVPASNISMERGSGAQPVEYPEENFSSYEDFKKANTGQGSLMFKVYTGREAIVIEGAECVITKTVNGVVHTIAKQITNSSGQTAPQALPAPPKELSQQAENTIQPFALYDASVTKPGFIRVVLKDIPIFDGVQSVQNVFMIIDS